MTKYSITETLLLSYALESKSEHPLAKAVLNKAKAENLELKKVTRFSGPIGLLVSRV